MRSTASLAEVALPSAIRSQQSVYGSTLPFSTRASSPWWCTRRCRTPDPAACCCRWGVRRLRLHHPARNAHYCLTRVTQTRAGECEADIEVMDQAGAVLLSVEGLRMSAGVSEAEQANRTLNERLLTIEWEPRELPDTQKDGRWLVFSTADAADPLARQITDAINTAAVEGASTCAARWEAGRSGAHPHRVGGQHCRRAVYRPRARDASCRRAGRRFDRHARA